MYRLGLVFEAVVAFYMTGLDWVKGLGSPLRRVQSGLMQLARGVSVVSYSCCGLGDGYLTCRHLARDFSAYLKNKKYPFGQNPFS